MNESNILHRHQHTTNNRKNKQTNEQNIHALQICNYLFPLMCAVFFFSFFYGITNFRKKKKTNAKWNRKQDGGKVETSSIHVSTFKLNAKHIYEETKIKNTNQNRTE